jgi:hypothetical protein
MVCFQTKNPSLGKIFGASDWKMLIYFTAICNILWMFAIFYDHPVHVVFIWYIFSSFGIMHQENLATLVRPLLLVALGAVQSKSQSRVTTPAS